MSDVRLGLIPDDTIPDWCAQADQPPFVCATSELEDISYEDVESSLVSYELEFVRAVAATLDVAPEDVEIRDVRPASVADIGLGVDWLVRASTNADALEYDSTLQDPERGALSMPTGAYGNAWPVLMPPETERSSLSNQFAMLHNADIAFCYGIDIRII